MEINKCIKERRSVRKYLNKDVPLRLILELIDSAHFAPSSGNIQNWNFIIVKNNLFVVINNLLIVLNTKNL